MTQLDPIFHEGPRLDDLEVEWLSPEAGFEITPCELSMPAEHQAQKLEAAGVDPAVFGNTVDPSFFIGIGIHAGTRSGISAEGNVNMVQRLAQMRPVRLGETLTVRGRIEAVEEVPRGQTVQTTVIFEDVNGQPVIDASRKSLRPDPTKGARRGAGDRPPPVVPDTSRTRVLAEHGLTPERVRSYSTEGNSIHYEEDAARRAGFRAPMIGGGMGVHYLAAALWSTGTPDQLELSVYFRRPIFWDEQFTSAVLGDPKERTTWEGLCLLRDEGEAGLKVLTEARVESIA